MSQGPFGLENAEFWTEPFKNEEAVTAERISKRAVGLFVDTPTVAYLDLNETVPLIGLRVLTLRDEQSLRFAESAILVAVRQEDGALFASTAVRPNPGGTEPSEPGDPGEGLVIEPIEIDLAERLPLGRNRATYLVAVVARDRVSNRVRVLVHPSSKAYDDPAVVEFARKRRAQAAPATAYPAPATDGGLPSYERRPESPPVPAEPGIALEVDRVALLEPGASLVLRGSFRLPAREEHRRAGAGPGEPAAVVPIVLVLAGAEQAGPSLLPLRVESRAPLDEKGQAAGFFTLDLLELPGMPRIPQTYFLYAFSGEVMAGPVPVALVTEKILRTIA